MADLPELSKDDRARLNDEIALARLQWQSAWALAMNMASTFGIPLRFAEPELREADLTFALSLVSAYATRYLAESQPALGRKKSWIHSLILQIRRENPECCPEALEDAKVEILEKLLAAVMPRATQAEHYQPPPKRLSEAEILNECKIDQKIKTHRATG
jgi:hypothetical protein